MPTAADTILDLKTKALDGRSADLSQYKGQVVMIVNVASECGLTPQYAGLEALYRQYKVKGFRILAFPSNDFAGQEPGTPEQIRHFCSSKFDVTFDLFEKAVVKGPGKHPVYAFLTSEETNPGLAGDIEWNFGKFLLNKQGKVVARFHPKVTPDAPEVISQIEALLAE
jgi:glutathione peroxidase